MNANSFFNAGARHVNNFNSYIHGVGSEFRLGPRTFSTTNALRGGLAFGLGAVALRNAQDSYHKMKYGEIGGSMLSAAMGATAAAGAYHVARNSGAMKTILNHTAARLGRVANYFK